MNWCNAGIQIETYHDFLDGFKVRRAHIYILIRIWLIRIFSNFPFELFTGMGTPGLLLSNPNVWLPVRCGISRLCTVRCGGSRKLVITTG